MTKRWKCTVCDYIHVGSEPPDVCPICGSDRSQFIETGEEKSGLFHEIVAAFKIHPVLAHFPNGLIPTAAIFLLASILTGQPRLENVVFWLVLTSVAVVPFSLATGIHDWHKHFGKHLAPVFYKKLGLALTLFVLGLAATGLRYENQDLLKVDDWYGWLYVLSMLGMLCCVGLLGHFGTLLSAQVAQTNGKSTTASSSLTANDSPVDGWPDQIVVHAPEAILVADTKGVIRFWNHGAERMFGVKNDDAIGQSLNLIIPENLRQRHWDGWARAMQTGKSHYGEDEMMRVPAIKSDGTRLSVEFSVVMLKDAELQLSGVAAILRDVSEQWSREKKLKSQLETCLKGNIPIEK
jgi:PAS domain S-box-containing protein